MYVGRGICFKIYLLFFQEIIHFLFPKLFPFFRKPMYNKGALKLQKTRQKDIVTIFLILFWKVIQLQWITFQNSLLFWKVLHSLVYYSEKCFIVAIESLFRIVWEKWSQCPFLLFSQFGARVCKCDRKVNLVWRGWPKICRLTTRIDWQIKLSG